MGLHKKSVYPLEVKLEAIRLRQEGYSVKEIQKLLNIKSESQVYTWGYWYRDGEHHRLSQPIGKQYSNGLGPEGSTTEESLMIRNEILEQQVKILKKYKKMERKWYAKYS
ncbi:helix-turn-helix domain-containing protein [Erysipelothrix sp. P66]|uniref:helix-turn-helix domain-containing protein n=1 Tax=Erysipelothrix sp. P66 TaxID=3141531 RepID=UPI00315DC499